MTVFHWVRDKVRKCLIVEGDSCYVQWLFDLRRQKVYMRNAWYHSFGSCQSVCGALSTVLCFTKYCLHFLPSLVCFVKSTPTLLQSAEPGEVHGNRLSLVCARDAALCAPRWKSSEMRINLITVLWRRRQHLHGVLNASMWVQACFLQMNSSDNPWARWISPSHCNKVLIQVRGEPHYSGVLAVNPTLQQVHVVKVGEEFKCRN